VGLAELLRRMYDAFRPNASVRPHVTACLGLHTVVVGCLLGRRPSFRCVGSRLHGGGGRLGAG
jgi:hypothetical protein